MYDFAKVKSINFKLDFFVQLVQILSHSALSESV